MHGGLNAWYESIQAVPNFGIRRNHFPTKAVVDGQPRFDAPFILRVNRRGPRSQTPAKIANALIEDNRRSEKEVRERVAQRERRREDDEAVRHRRLVNVHLGADKATTKLRGVFTLDPGDRVAKFICVLRRISWSTGGSANGGVAA